ncbi:hypothetical protein AURDEDRAFT_154587 [Auricularia subglabra TFB-10046 SS5]|nr:hypothetical protein AURDEDRAFT_154587 [Auricularia subglabra TFB-10046 SS5]
MVHNSPRKVIPLNDSDDDRRPASTSAITRRAFFCGVVVETDLDGKDISRDVRDIVASLGEPLSNEPSNNKPLGPSSSEPTIASSSSTEELPPGPLARKRALTNGSKLNDLINEFVTTERSYVKRLRVLKESYADPLRKYAKSKDTAIIPPWDANTLFGNIDNLLPVNEAFLTDLEKMMLPNGPKVVGGIGDVTLKHFEELKGFDCYRHYYAKREDAQRIFQREMLKKSTMGFAGYIERIKETTMDNKNRVGLRELLMDPVQRIPRYTMLFRLMMQHMHPDDPQRAKLQKADALASKIALCETDDATKRMAVLLSLPRTIEGCPADIVSNSRRLVDIIDVADVPPNDTPLNASASLPPLHCTLLLFDDKLMLLRRPSPHQSGRSLAGLDEVEKATKLGTLPNAAALKKSGLVCKGIFDLCEVVFTDVGGPNVHMYLEVPPNDPSDPRWSGRQFRALSVIVQPGPTAQSPASVKKRFLDNLWTAQAMYRTRSGRSLALQSCDYEVENRAGRTTLARTYYNVYQRKAYLAEQLAGSKKSKVILHIDQSGSADPVPFGASGSGGPFVVIRIQPLANEHFRYSVSTRQPDEDPDEDEVHKMNIPERVVQTIHQFGLFKFQTGTQSRPGTPTASTRSRAAIFGLDAISRNLFGTTTSRGGSGHSGADPFSTGGTQNSHRRARSTASSSARTQTDSLLKSSDRSNSTGVTTPDEDGMRTLNLSLNRSPARRKLVKRGKSPGASGSEGESPRRRPVSVAADRDVEKAEKLPPRTEMDASEWDLTQRLELARRNSQNQRGGEPPTRRELERDPLVDETILEEEPPQPFIMQSRRPMTPSRAHGSTHSSPTRSTHASPTRASPQRPLGPRSPSTKSSRSVRSPTPDDSIELDVERALERTLTQISHDLNAPSTPARKRVITEVDPDDEDDAPSRRQPLAANILNEFAVTPTKSPGAAVVEPLSIKKKAGAVASMRGSPTTNRRTQSMVAPHVSSKGSPRSAKPPTRGLSMDQAKLVRPPPTPAASAALPEKDVVDRVLVVAETTREDIQSSRRAIKKIKLELDNRGTGANAAAPAPATSAFPRSPQSRAISTQASARVAQLRQRIEERSAANSSRATPDREPSGATGAATDEWAASVENLVAEAERKLKKATNGHDMLQDDLRQLVSAFKEKLEEAEKARGELQSAKAQCELVKNLLSDVTEEKELMYEAFNKELDCMYEDTNLPATEAWQAMTRDLRAAKDARNTLEKENAKLKQQLAEAKLERDQSLRLLRQHNLIS